MSVRHLTIIVFIGFLVLFTAFFPGCRNNGNIPSNNDLSYFPNSYVSAQIPPGWASFEGPQFLMLHEEADLAFNSWGESGFWAREAHSANSITYSPATVISQVPEGGIYVALIQIYPPGGGSNDTKQYALNDLSGLVKVHDWRLDASSSAVFKQFYKWGRYLELEVACNAKASDATVADLNNLLQSWKFDKNPAGDNGWAFFLAIKLLPREVVPLEFSNQTSLSYDEQGDNRTVARRSEVSVLPDKTVVFRFTYYWNVQEMNSSLNPSDMYHWWEIDVLPSGKAVLKAQGGTRLP